MGRHSSGERRRRLEEGVARGATGTADDLRILLGTRRLLLLSTVIVVVIFAAYFAVLAAAGHLGAWLLLLVVPAGLAGVSVGALLDRAHSARSKGPSAGGGDAAAEESEVAQEAEEPGLAGSGHDEGEPEA